MNTDIRAGWIAKVAVLMPAKPTTADILTILSIAYNYGFGEGLAEAGKLIRESNEENRRALV